jgi:hypothetical protein
VVKESLASSRDALSAAEVGLLRTAFGIRVGPDDRVVIPIRHKWKSPAAMEIFPLHLLIPCLVVPLSPQALGLPGMLLPFPIYYLALAAFFVIRRQVILLPGGEAILRENGREFRLSISPASICWRDERRAPCLELEGGQFSLTRRWFAGVEARRQALAALTAWVQHGGGGKGGTEEGREVPPVGGAGSFLDGLEVSSLTRDQVTFRAPTDGLLAVSLSLGMLILIPAWVAVHVPPPYQLVELTRQTRGLLDCVAWLLAGAIVVVVRRSRPKFIATRGAGIAVIEGRRKRAMSAEDCNFTVRPPDSFSYGDAAGNTNPTLVLVGPKRSWDLYSSSRYGESELGDLALEMNRFVWGGQPIG